MSKVKLKEIGTFKNGLNFSADRVAKGCKMIGIPDFGDRYLADLSNLSEVDNEIVPDECTLKDGDILFVRSNGNKALVGRTMIINGISERITFSGFCIRFRPNREIAIPLYLLLVYFDARTKIHLQNYLSARTDENAALFVGLRAPYNRLTIGGVESMLRKLGSELSIPKVHPHKFRRTLATTAIDKGMPIEQVQQLLGHQKIDTTLHYAMVKQSNVKQAHRKYIG